MKTFLDTLIPYDYILFGGSFALFILLVILAILLRNKTFISVFLFILAFSIILLGPTLGYSKMHQYLFKNTTKLLSQKKLTFTKAVVVYGELTNDSNKNFSLCKVKAKAYKVSGNKYKDYLFALNPFKKVSILEYEIDKGEKREFKIILEPFNHAKDYNISVEASCR